MSNTSPSGISCGRTHQAILCNRFLGALWLCATSSFFFGNTFVAYAAGEFPIFGLQFSPDGKLLVATSNSTEPPGPVVIWNVDDWSIHHVHRPATGGRHVDFSPDGSLLAYGTNSGVVGLLNVASGTLNRQINAHSNAVYCVAFSRDGITLVSSSADRSIKLWNTETGQRVRRFDGHTDTVCGVAISPDGKTLLSGSIDQQTRLWDLRTGQVRQTFHSSDGIVRRVKFSHDGQHFLTSRWDGKVRLRDTASGRLRAILSGGSDCADLTFDKRLVVTSGQGSTAQVFSIELDDPSNDQKRQIEQLIEQFSRDSYKTREAAAAELVALGMIAETQLREAMESDDAEIRVRARRIRQKILSPEPIAELPGHRGDVEFVCFSPDAKLLATACRGGDIKVWNVNTFSEIATLEMGLTE